MCSFNFEYLAIIKAGQTTDDGQNGHQKQGPK